MANSDHRTAKSVESNRLVYYLRDADAQFWDDHWREIDLSRRDFARALDGDLWRFEQPFLKYLPRDKPVLEAGCGLAKLVVALEARGYAAEGVEWAPETVDRVRRLFPQLRISAGDVLHLDVPDSYYGGYISIGVMEHRREGPLPFLREAYRVLAPDGVGLIAIPHFNALRSVKARLRLYDDPTAGATFYQYAFSSQEFEGFVAQAGFTVEDRIGYDSYKTIMDELSLLRHSTRVRAAKSALRRLARTRLAEQYCSHMMLYVCRSTKRPDRAAAGRSVAQG